MVGGGLGSFIGPVHARAATLDGRWRLVAGAFSRDEWRNSEGARILGVAADRTYLDWRTMIAVEARRPDGARAVAIVTPNGLHAPIAIASLEAGLAVISDKPAATSLLEARGIAAAVARSGRAYMLTMTYAGYAMVREARALLALGVIGVVEKVTVEYSQGWLRVPARDDEPRHLQDWRDDVAEAGVGALGDIGSHAFHIAEYVSGLRAERLCADVSVVTPGRRLDDDANVLLRFSGGARGVLIVSQAAAGERNSIRVKAHGEHGTLIWSHDAPERLGLLKADMAETVFHAGDKHLSPEARAARRLPIGHPEGFIEAFATLYGDFADVMTGQTPARGMPGIEDALRGMAFIEASLRSSRDSAWTDLEVRS